MRLSFAKWLWIFPLAYLLHVIEEFRSVGPSHGINVSLRTFLILSTVAWLLMTCGIVLAHRFGFPHFMGVCLGATVFLNGLSHIINSLIYGRYDAGLISGSVIFIPLGLDIDQLEKQHAKAEIHCWITSRRGNPGHRTNHRGVKQLGP